ncbi:hypothetical protein BON30_21065 [Cystobacter ferrugineus]|uniref:Carboxypeptidase regulatory-like domain-containing protein n=1 Tax=Cystobacter ferrugineus TaxID=83449 RepID=A0A1L9B8Z5_9BACT|nr:hypothetical protein BON30_21065 [Cystobacter ferrugineus]
MRNFGLAQEPEELVSASLLVAELDRWLSSTFTQRTLHELYEAVTGTPPVREPTLKDQRAAERIKSRLAEAFRRGELLALPAGPARLKKWPVPAPVRAPSPLLTIPLLEQIEQLIKPREEKKEEKKPTAWVEFELVDSEGEPLAGVGYKLTLPDGSTREGKVDAQGRVRVEGIEPGECVVTFPELDA